MKNLVVRNIRASLAMQILHIINASYTRNAPLDCALEEGHVKNLVVRNIRASLAMQVLRVINKRDMRRTASKLVIFANSILLIPALRIIWLPLLRKTVDLLLLIDFYRLPPW